MTPQYTLFVEGGISDKNRADFASAEVFRVNSSTVKSYTRIGIEKENFFLRAFWNQFDVENANTPLIPFLSVTDPAGNVQGLTILSNSYDIASQYRTTLFTNHRVTTGANYRLNTISGSFVRRSDTEQRFGVYLQDEWQPVEYFSINFGGRIDLHNEIHPTYSPRIAIFLFPHPDHTFRFSGSLAYRPPTLLDADLVTVTSTIGLGPTTSTTTTGTSNLEPEKIISYELEYQGWFIQHRLRARGALFFNHISDFITSNVAGTSFINNGVGDIYGGEIGAEFFATTWLRGFANVAYQQIGQMFTADHKRGAPHLKLNGGLRGKWNNGFNGEVTIHYVGAATYPITPSFSTFAALSLIPASAVPNQRVDSYTLVNLRGGYKFWQDRAEVSIAIYNALNDRHREHPQGDVIGSRVLGWLTMYLD